MPAGKYSFYFHTDDRTDMLAAGTLETVSQPLRGEFIRTASIAGSVLYRADSRLPGLVTELFDGQLRYGQLVSLLAALTGQYDRALFPPAETLPGVTGGVSGQTDKTDRRRFTLLLPDSAESRQVAELLEGTPSRQRGMLLRNLIVAGFALHTLDPRLPRLLASMPVPPTDIKALGQLAAQVAGVTVSGATEGAASAGKEDKPPEQAASPAEQSVLRQNMKKLF
ncbi:plasmid partitioning/stability family protein [Kosakonia radicincitans]|uniref:plasmid partitioning/stability family protein n=1 Tax=Kosakonia radicincitans TaxID=283686 RepID=UPI00236808CF|nr:plasmid partitioning/stability family protein [Kosakonia radicincitans]MDD7998258.1 plasmid partitioning/stability family protein [Kosakonia radicincitans]